VKLKEIIAVLEDFAPPLLQESYDNSGLQCGNPEMKISAALVCLDVTPEVVAEAKRKKCNLIISHHPVIFGNLKSISTLSPPGKILWESIAAGIAIYSCHTNLDHVSSGVNAMLLRKLGLKGKQRILSPLKGVLRKLVVFCPEKHTSKLTDALFSAGAGKIGNYDECAFYISGKGSFRPNEKANPFIGSKGKRHFEEEVRVEVIFPSWITADLLKAMKKAHPYEEVAYYIQDTENLHQEVGSGMFLELDTPIPPAKLLDLLRKKLKTKGLRFSKRPKEKISGLAVCGGSGSFLIPAAKREKAQVLITGDIKYHAWFDAEPDLWLIDAGHFETEQFTSEIFYDVLKKNFPKFAVRFSNVKTNPVNYF
jgi:dinuclear metal center YbgI/SA1388 family protein